MKEIISSIIVGLVLAGLVVLVIVKMIKDKKSGKTSCGCGGSCSGCAMSGSCKSKE